MQRRQFFKLWAGVPLSGYLGATQASEEARPILLVDDACMDQLPSPLQSAVDVAEVWRFQGDVTELWRKRLQPYWAAQGRGGCIGLTSAQTMGCLRVLGADRGYRILSSEVVASSSQADVVHWYMAKDAPA